MSLRRTPAIIAALATIVVITATAAAAGTIGGGNFGISCNTSYAYTTDKKGYTIQPGQSFKVHNRLSEIPVSVQPVSQLGTKYATKNIPGGAYASWVLPAGTYHLQARAAVNTNCNSILPGHGNTTWYYNVIYGYDL